MSVEAKGASASAAAKRKQFSRNKKKNWKRFLNTKEIDVSNEERLKDELSGGSFAGKADAELFFVDKAPSADRAPAPKKKKEKKLLHCEKALLPNPHTKAVSARKERTTPRSKPAASKAVNPAAAVSVANKKQKPQAALVATVDLWGAEPEAEAESGSAVQMPRTMRQKPSSSAPAVKLAHPGQSYNPSYDDHVDAVSMAVQHISKEEEADRFWKEKLGTTVQQINSYATYAQEMAIVPATKAEEEGGSEHESDSEADEDSDERESAPSDPVRKTRAQRNKQARFKEEQRQREAEKQQKARENELYRLKTLKRQVVEEEEEQEQTLAERQKRRATQDGLPKKLSKYKFQTEPMEVQLTEELAGSLRQLKPEGSLVKDRFKSLQERNALEVRQKIKLQRKYRQKEYEKRSFKNNPWA